MTRSACATRQNAERHPVPGSAAGSTAGSVAGAGAGAGAGGCVVAGAIAGTEAGTVAGAVTGAAAGLAMGITKLAAYRRCLSVMASVIPRSRNTALATILPPISLSIDPNAFRPSSVSQSYFKASSDFLTETVVGICVGHAPRLFCRLQFPLLPSLNESATGVMASSVRVAHPVPAIASSATTSIFIRSPIWTAA